MHFGAVLDRASSTANSKAIGGVEQLPSGKFCVNNIVRFCAMLAFNLLHTLGEKVVATPFGSGKNQGNSLALEDGVEEYPLLHGTRGQTCAGTLVALRQKLLVV